MKTIVKIKAAAWRKAGILLAVLTIAAAPLHATVYTVTNTLNSGAGSLRQAITDANANPGADVIQFAIPVLGNTFEASGVNSWAVIQVNTTLPTITEAVLIDGFTQTNTNLGSMSGRVVGVDGIAQAAIPYPDVYIVPSSTFVFPNTNTNTAGNGLTVNAVNVTIRGLAISGFGNTSPASSTASHHADVVLVRSATERVPNFLLHDCFLSSDPRGAYPALIGTSTRRRTQGGSVVVGGNNNGGIIRNNYMAYAGTYHIHFNGNFDHLGVGPSNTTLVSKAWTITQNILVFNGKSGQVTSGKAADAINMMRCHQFEVTANYIEDSEQVGIDMGYNSHDNYIANNTVTGMVNTTAAAPLAGMRVSLGSQRDTLFKNLIFNNSGSTFKGGIWIDRSTVSTNTVVQVDNSYNLVQENVIHSNNASAIVLSDNGNTINAQFNTITKNSTYNNTGLGIDLGITNTGSTLVTVNDDGDGDAGVNDKQNFPIIDSSKATATHLYIWGKAPANSIIEFYKTDGQSNSHGGLGLNYGEGKTFIAAVTEGSAADAINQIASYNVDGNVATNNVQRFGFAIPYTGYTSTDDLTATATVNGNTSEFGPRNVIDNVLNCSLLNFKGVASGNKSILNWEAICTNDFRFFVIEHSTDGSHFSSVGTVTANDASPVQKLSFDHSQNGSENNFYRLKMVNTDGTFKLSAVALVGASLAPAQKINILQNPFVSSITLQVAADVPADMMVRLLDAEGKVVLSKKVAGNKGINTVQITDVAHLAAGNYHLMVTVQGKVYTQKLIKR
jgi:hypothetical protein